MLFAFGLAASYVRLTGDTLPSGSAIVHGPTSYSFALRYRGGYLPAGEPHRNDLTFQCYEDFLVDGGNANPNRAVLADMSVPGPPHGRSVADALLRYRRGSPRRRSTFTGDSWITVSGRPTYGGRVFAQADLRTSRGGRESAPHRLEGAGQRVLPATKRPFWLATMLSAPPRSTETARPRPQGVPEQSTCAACLRPLGMPKPNRFLAGLRLAQAALLAILLRWPFAQLADLLPVSPAKASALASALAVAAAGRLGITPSIWSQAIIPEAYAGSIFCSLWPPSRLPPPTRTDAPGIG